MAATASACPTGGGVQQSVVEVVHVDALVLVAVRTIHSTCISTSVSVCCLLPRLSLAQADLLHPQELLHSHKQRRVQREGVERGQACGEAQAVSHLEVVPALLHLQLRQLLQRLLHPALSEEVVDQEVSLLSPLLHVSV
eukprot:CAMPEP_0173168412 /NCGR_PEP_ID=MMETSP1141-20130122/132_1 /TAXON_ID=483371 /ORGANISM="non described non described, Strain CCMP2298" /LENGTH=138 /DNA_ID=CAMNT_0014090121 /DNA_START=653 /DNA_END=1070 /DNA_ORIENTATION=-